jgi:hypothetical protein
MKGAGVLALLGASSFIGHVSAWGGKSSPIITIHARWMTGDGLSALD